MQSRKMKLYFYKAPFCPRCYLTKKYLKELKGEYPELEFETIDLLIELSRFRQDGIRFPPTLRIKEKTLTSGIPCKERIRNFIEENQTP